MEIKRILVTGCSGLIGRKVCEIALEKGYDVTGIDLKQPLPYGGIHFIKADIRNKKAMKKSLIGIDAVIHLAAITSNVEFEKDLQRCYNTNVNGFMNVINAAWTNGCKKFIYASSAAVYQNEFSEDTVLNIQNQRSSYAKTKLMNEMIADSYEHVHKMRTIGVRFFNVYGTGENKKGDYASIVSKFINNAALKKPLVIYGDGMQVRDMVNVYDAARITLVLMEKGTEKIYNVGTGKATTYKKIGEYIDKNNIQYIKNPLSTYQKITKANLKRLRKIIGDYKFIDINEWISEMIINAK